MSNAFLAQSAGAGSETSAPIEYMRKTMTNSSGSFSTSYVGSSFYVYYSSPNAASGYVSMTTANEYEALLKAVRGGVAYVVVNSASIVATHASTYTSSTANININSALGILDAGFNESLLSTTYTGYVVDTGTQAINRAYRLWGGSSSYGICPYVQLGSVASGGSSAAKSSGTTTVTASLYYITAPTI